MSKKRLYLVQVNGRYGQNVYVPYSVGLLWAYARTFPEIVAAYDMVDFLYLKEPIEKAVARLENPDLIGISCYIWNFEWSKAFAKAVKEKFPKCTIVVGGVQVPDRWAGFLCDNPYFDFAIYGEGEGAFADFLRAHMLEEYGECLSLMYRVEPTIPWYVWAHERRPFVDLVQLRSPYLDGVFDQIWDREPRWQVLQETHRGCPYACSFCAWGQAALTELRPFPEDRVKAEIEWFGQHKVDYLDNADANYGILKRDIELTQFLADTKRKYDFPRTFRTSFAKNSNETIWTIANILNEAKMLKSVTLAMQSMDEDVLVNIQRKNIKFSKFGDYVRRYEEAGLPTYTELILGLPGETYETFVDGIDKNLEAGQHSGLFIYLNIMLNNTEQKKSEYIKAHGIQTADMQAMLSHGTPDDSVPREKQETVIATSTMSHNDWKNAYIFGKIIEVFHSLGLLQLTAMERRKQGVRYRDFYSSLLFWLYIRPDSIAGQEFANLRKLLENAVKGGPWDCVDPRLGEISWPPEEFIFARLCCDLERFYDEMEQFTPITKEQRYAIVPPVPGKEAEWARDNVWFGRKGNRAIKKRPERSEASSLRAVGDREDAL